MFLFYFNNIKYCSFICVVFCNAVHVSYCMHVLHVFVCVFVFVFDFVLYCMSVCTQTPNLSALDTRGSYYLTVGIDKCS